MKPLLLLMLLAVGALGQELGQVYEGHPVKPYNPLHARSMTVRVKDDTWIGVMDGKIEMVTRVTDGGDLGALKKMYGEPSKVGADYSVWSKEGFTVTYIPGLDRSMIILRSRKFISVFGR